MGAPRFRIEIDEVKKRELDGFSGVVARFLGQYFDELVTQIASGRASRLNKRLNDEIMKRVGLFKEYGVFQGIDYTPSEVVLHFDLTRFRSEGIAGYVFADGAAGDRPPLSLVPSQGWLPLLHDQAQRTRPAQLGQRWNLLSCLRPSRPRVRPVLPLAATGATTSTRPRRTARMPAGPATGLGASPATSIAIPSRGPYRSTAFTTRSGTSTSTRCIPHAEFAK